MAVDVSWIAEGMPLFGFALIFVLAYAVILKTKILGESKAIIAIASLILSVIFVSFTDVNAYITTLAPWFAVILTLSFFFLLIILFIVKEPDVFMKVFGIIFVILLAIVAIAVIFYVFPSTQALLPGELDNSSDHDYYDKEYDRYCDTYIDYDYFDEDACYKREGYYKCFTDHKAYTYDKCISDVDEYKCYDYEDEYENCNYKDYDRYDKDYRYRNYDEDSIFVRTANYIYKDKIITAFWLLIIAAIAWFIVTR